MTQKVAAEVAARPDVPVSQTRAVHRGRVKYDKKAESEFFVDNSALAGFSTERILYMAVRELIENSLDSCETGHILPRVSLSLKIVDPVNDLWKITCEDNGIGVPSEKVPVAVCSFLTSGKYVEKQQRGLFGVGLKMIAAFSTKDTDQPLKVWSKSLDEEEEYYFELRTDISTNRPIVLNKKLLKNGEGVIAGKSGFRVEAMLRAKLSPITKINTKTKINEYISQSSVVNPYAIIEFETDEGKVTFERRTDVMPQPAKEVLPHPADMDLQTLKKAIMNFMNQKTTLQGVLAGSFQKLSSEKARQIVAEAGLENKQADQYDEHELIKIVNICKQTKFHMPNTDHLSPIGEEILTAGMTSEYTIITGKDDASQQAQLSVKILKPSLTAYSSRTCVINNRPTIVECGIAYGGDISSFKMYRFANKIPLLYDEGSDVAKEVVSEVEINKMGISKKEVKEQFANPDAKSDRAVELLPLHIFFHICSTKIPYKTAGKESIASEGDLKRYMKACLSDLYRKVSAQIRKELRMKDAQNRLSLYKYYIPLIVDAISESITVDSKKLEQAFTELAEKHVSGEITQQPEREDEITSERLEEEVVEAEIDGEVVKRDKAQIAINAARKKGERARPRAKKEGQTTLAEFPKKGGKK
ncbi:MAG: DNA topoisomerase VI subunit B [Nitrososphaera sp.]|uniref:DNA topoisomerase VI subunit B n=1 Tax=Nitrososphaera sp. TaxID=1971748 RepID=UPI0017DDC49C|nr:DNA topoisomerase VI subunit B [Nitrososphaera sp.]NWG37949.1 DNA topoisomerase VI subunit B [Nitrososphaera sp.]